MKTIFFTLAFAGLMAIGVAVAKHGLASKPEPLGALADIESVGPTVKTCRVEKGCGPTLAPSTIPAQVLVAAAKPEKGADVSREIEPWVRQMHDLLREGRTEGALALLTEAVQTDPKNERALLELARIHSHYGGDPEKAEGLLRRALDVNPENGAALDELLFLYEGEKNGSKPRVIRELAEKFPRSASVAEAYGRSLVDVGSAGEAISYLRVAAENSPHPERALRSLAEAYGQLNDSRQVAETFSQLLSFQEKLLVDAQRRGFDTADLEQDMISNQIRLASALVADQQRDRAESLLHGVLQRAPGNQEAESLLARLRGT